jgi:hypothetical protein
MKALRFINLWLVLGWGQVALVVLLSLVRPPSFAPDFMGVDKVIHLLVYAFVTLWFGLCLIRPKAYRILGIALILMGIILELIQGEMGYRSMSYMDMTSNGLGVLLGWLLSRTRLSGALILLESSLPQAD